jgi:hypothetical protein
MHGSSENDRYSQKQSQVSFGKPAQRQQQKPIQGNLARVACDVGTLTVK